MPEEPVRVLITNDDGVAAPGIRQLALAVRAAGFDVTVAAPQEEASGMSAALSAVLDKGRLVYTTHPIAGLDDVPTYGVAASPGYIAVLAGLEVFGPRPQLLLSGINRGANAGHAVLHSGTVGAALTAANHGMRAMAVSLDVLSPAEGSSVSGGAAIAALDTVDDETRHWTTAADLAARLLRWLATAPERTVLNLNVPDRPADRIAGLRRATLAPFGQVQMAVAEAGEGYVRTAIEENGAPPDPRHRPRPARRRLCHRHRRPTPRPPRRHGHSHRHDHCDARSALSALDVSRATFTSSRGWTTRTGTPCPTGLIGPSSRLPPAGSGTPERRSSSSLRSMSRLSVRSGSRP